MNKTLSTALLPLLLALLLGGCQVFSGGPDSDPASGESGLLDSEQQVIPAGDDPLRRSVAAGQRGANAGLDQSIAPEVQTDVDSARAQLEQGLIQVNAASDEPSDIWDRLRPHLGMDVDLQNPRVKSQLDWYIKHPSYIDRTAARASRYLHHIVNEIEARQVPGEFALLPIVESAFDPFAYSPGQASGLWQFIPSTGRIFDLNQNWWKDGRRDILDSTAAALTYLERLSRQFDGNWVLALASYNSGAGTVRKAIRHNRNRNQPTDYWHLRLPNETREYVPKLLALAELFRSPEKYGIELPPLPDEPYFEVVDTGSQIDLAQAAEMAGIELEELYLLNPSYNHWATDPNGPHRLLIPADHAAQFREQLASIPPEKRLNWARYEVEAGDSLIRIARKFNTTPGVIREINEIDGNLIRIGQPLLIPQAANKKSAYTLSAGQRLAAKQQRAAGKGKTRIEYKVKSGDSYWNISRKFGVDLQALVKGNGKAPGDPLFPGQKLVIWTETASNTLALKGNREDMVRKVGYRVRSGDSLYLIASRYDVKVQDIVSWNEINPKHYLQPGDQLTLFVDIRRNR